MAKKIIPVFYAADKNYVPYLAVALTALKEHRSTEYEYHIHILYSGTPDADGLRVQAMAEEDFLVQFDDIGEMIGKISDCMHCRDYYTSAIYYRLFIPELYPQYDKVLYMDCDTVALRDVADLYLTDIGDNYIGAIPDQAVEAIPAFRDYTKDALDIVWNRYFNSGVIVMNLKAFREIGFYDKFCAVLRSYDFTIAPDQDCLNLICKDRVYYYEADWNRMPVGGKGEKLPFLIHYNLTMKPWHYDGILYEEIFWEYAEKSGFIDRIRQDKAAFTPEMVKRDEEGGAKLVALAAAEAANPNNYIRSVGKRK